MAVPGIEMHTGKMTVVEATEFFVNEGYQVRPMAEKQAKRSTFNPQAVRRKGRSARWNLLRRPIHQLMAHRVPTCRVEPSLLESVRTKIWLLR